jgi:hypothetical protein
MHGLTGGDWKRTATSGTAPVPDPPSARTSSGSICSAREVKPTRSANSTDTTLRSSCASGSTSAAAAPHSEQNFAPTWSPWPHDGQTLTLQAYG